MKNIVRRNDVVDTHQLEESFKISRNYKSYGTSDRVNKTNWTKVNKTVQNKRYHLRSENDETLDSIEPVTGNSKKGNRNPIKQQTERCVQITNNQREFSFARKRSFPRNKRKIPSSPEETNKKKQKMVVTVKGSHRQNQRIRHLKKLAKMIEKEKINGMARLRKEVEGIPQIHHPRRKVKKKLEVCTMKVTTQTT